MWMLTTDTFTKKPFRWNGTRAVKTPRGTFNVPARKTKRERAHLHPGRVPATLLAALNSGKRWGST